MGVKGDVTPKHSTLELHSLATCLHLNKWPCINLAAYYEKFVL